METKILAGLAIGLFLVDLTGTASASVLDPSFVKADTTNTYERLEFRTGIDGTGDWEIGLGMNTQAADQFVQAEGPSHDYWNVDTDYTFTYAIDVSGTATFNMGSIDLTWSDMDLGNTLQIHAKRDVTVTFGGVTLTGDPLDAWGTDYGYISIDPVNGFSLSGTINFGTLGSRSTEGVIIETGNISPVPVPAAAWLFGSGLIALVGFVRRKK